VVREHAAQRLGRLVLDFLQFPDALQAAVNGGAYADLGKVAEETIYRVKIAKIWAQESKYNTSCAHENTFYCVCTTR
jgi:hypothetical protein